MRAALIVILALAPTMARATRVLIVLSDADRSSTQEALEGLRAGWDIPIDTAPAGEPLPPGPYDAIIAFGWRAAERAREADGPLVIALAPAYHTDRHRPATAHVAMTPSPEQFVKFLAAAGVHRLLAVRGRRADADFQRRAGEAGKAAGVVIGEGILPSPGNLPDLLRSRGLAADGVWLAPDPGAVTPETFAAAREFARARSLPFFAPAIGLVSNEIRAELTVSFRDCGAEAGRAARELLAGRPVARVVYPSAARVELSTETARAPL
jgi:hypothetical protein